MGVLTVLVECESRKPTNDYPVPVNLSPQSIPCELSEYSGHQDFSIRVLKCVIDS